MFLTSPGLVLEVVEFARKNEVVVFPGALTPIEVITAWKAGADLIKVYPCGHVGGDNYIRALKMPLPQELCRKAFLPTHQNIGRFRPSPLCFLARAKRLREQFGTREPFTSTISAIFAFGKQCETRT